MNIAKEAVKAGKLAEVGDATHEAAENMVSFTPAKNQGPVSCTVSRQRITLGDTITISGAVNRVFQTML